MFCPLFAYLNRLRKGKRESGENGWRGCDHKIAILPFFRRQRRQKKRNTLGGINTRGWGVLFGFPVAGKGKTGNFAKSGSVARLCSHNKTLESKIRRFLC